MKNNSGGARISYVVTGTKASGTAVVWLVYAGGKWTAAGCEVVAGGKKVKVGEEAVIPDSDLDD